MQVENAGAEEQRRLAHEDLLQRSDVETFLVATCKQVPHHLAEAQLPSYFLLQVL